MSNNNNAPRADVLIAERAIDAPPTLVWTAFTTPEHLAAFWGGHHAEVSADSVHVDLRVGGAISLTTVGADGSTTDLRFVFVEIDAPSRLVLTEPATGIVTQLRLEPRGNGTLVTIRQHRVPRALRTDQARTGLAGILDQLERLVARLAHSGPTAPHEPSPTEE